MTTAHRLLHLGFAFPPGYQALNPTLNPAGHLFEVRMIGALRQQMEVTSVGILPVHPAETRAKANADDGLAHDLILAEYAPHAWHRWRSYHRLCQYYRRLEASGRTPDTVLFYNIRPIYSQFAGWLSRRTNRPRLVLLLLDSSQLGCPPPKQFTRWRRRLKPFHVEERSFTSFFDACIGMSPDVKTHFPNRPFLWMPGACEPESVSIVEGISPPETGPITFGFFGSLGSHSGAFDLARAFMKSTGEARLRVAGYGKQGPAFADLVRSDPRIQFVGSLPTHADCLRFGAECDVLINPRPAGSGNQNSFPSKLFEYAMCGRPILSSRLAGSEIVLGDAGIYFSPADFDDNLCRALSECATIPRKELRTRGERIREHITNNYTWPAQVRRMTEFMTHLS